MKEWAVTLKTALLVERERWTVSGLLFSVGEEISEPYLELPHAERQVR